MVKLINITGKAISGEWGMDDETGEGIPVLRTTNFTNEGIVDYSNVVTRTITKKDIDNKFLKVGDIIIEKSGGSDKQPVGRVVYYDGPNNIYLFNNFTGLLRVKDSQIWLPKYIFYSLFSAYNKGMTRKFENKTTGLHNLKLDDYVSKLPIKQLSICCQKNICNKLDILREVIKKRRQQIEYLDLLVKARFVELFGDIEHNSKDFPIEKLADICEVSSSKRIYQNEQTSEGIPFLRISDLNARIDKGIEETELYISLEKYNELCLKKLVPAEGDILVTSRGTLGKCYIVKESDCFYFQDGMISWLSNISKKVTSTYISYLFSMDGIKKQIVSLQAGSTVAYLSITMLKKLNIIIPPIELQTQFTTFIEKVDKSKFGNCILLNFIR